MYRGTASGDADEHVSLPTAFYLQNILFINTDDISSLLVSSR